MKVYQVISRQFDRYTYCTNKSTMENATENMNDAENKIASICKNFLPHGSGFDCGTRFSFEESRKDKLVFYSDYHQMDEKGYYDGWSENIKIVITPSFAGFDIRITGIRCKNRLCENEYFYDIFISSLDNECNL